MPLTSVTYTVRGPAGNQRIIYHATPDNADPPYDHTARPKAPRRQPPKRVAPSLKMNGLQEHK